MKYVLRFITIYVFLFSSATAFACSATTAFGFQFGQPVPKKAPDVKVIWFQGGSDPGNVLRSFTAGVPEPLLEFPNYAYSSNRDRKVVYSITAFRQLVTDTKLLSENESRNSVLEKAKMEMAQLRQAWNTKYGLEYEQTSDDGLTWEATTPEVHSTIGTHNGQYIYIECENRALYRNAISIALKSAFGSH